MPKFKDMGEPMEMMAEPSEHQKHYHMIKIPKDALPWINEKAVGDEFQVLIKVRKTGEFEDNHGIENRMEMREVYVTKEEKTYA